jgi:hypothetical protein
MSCKHFEWRRRSMIALIGHDMSGTVSWHLGILGASLCAFASLVTSYSSYARYKGSVRWSQTEEGYCRFSAQTKGGHRQRFSALFASLRSPMTTYCRFRKSELKIFNSRVHWVHHSAELLQILSLPQLPGLLHVGLKPYVDWDVNVTGRPIVQKRKWH